MTRISSLCVLVLVLAVSLDARITRIEIQNTSEPAPDGYITIAGTAYGEVDPEHPLNAIIQDIELAPRNERGMVEYSMDITILRPPNGGNGLLFYEVPNRGWPLLRAFNAVLGMETFARQRGYTIVWSGIQGDVLKSSPVRHTITVPTASLDGTEITGWVWRALEVPLTASAASVPLYPPNNTHSVYEPVNLDAPDSVLTRQIGPDDPPTVIPRSDWAFATCDANNPFPGVPSSEHVCLKDGLEPRFAYAVRYRAKNPLVLGLGLAATRDFISFLRNDPADQQGTANPVYESIQAAIMQGASQSSQIARLFLHLGFNRDEVGRKVFDGMYLHVAATRTDMNVRFGMPAVGRAFRLNHLLPGWQSPFTWTPEYDTVAERSGWLLERCMESDTCPRIIHSVSSAEYWNSRASLTGTDTTGQYDACLPRNVRMYLIAGTQHLPAAFPPGRGICENLVNPNQYSYYLRALHVALEQWVVDRTEPPPSRIPTIRDGTLVPPDAVSIGWPEIPGVNYTGRVNALPLVGFGPDFNAEDITGIVSEQAKVVTGKAYTILVPRVDADGNEVAGIRPVALQAPTATFTGWNLQREGFAVGELCQNTGSYIPFTTTRAEREAAGDPRPSLEERYGDHEGYVEAVREAANRLVAQRFVLSEDAEAIIKDAEESDVLLPPAGENHAPLAVVNPAVQTITSAEAVLDGSQSQDPDGDPITYSWQATGMSAAISGGNTATPTVQFHDGRGEYTFVLTVADDKGEAATATATVVLVGP